MNEPEIAGVLLGALQEGRSIRFRAAGYSMFPALWPGDVLTVAPLRAPRAAAPGDIVLAVEGGVWFAHRLVQWSRAAARLRGDGQSDAHEVTAASVLGRVTEIRRFGMTLREGSLAGTAAAGLARLVGPASPLLARLARRIATA